MNRRDFIKGSTALAASAVLPLPATSAPSPAPIATGSALNSGRMYDDCLDSLRYVLYGDDSPEGRLRGFYQLLHGVDVGDEDSTTFIRNDDV